MSDLLVRVQALARRGEIRVSAHGLRELAEDDILLDDVLAGIGGALIIEEYSEDLKGPSLLVLQKDGQNRPIHIVWGIAKETTTPTVLVTGYRPDPMRWSEDFLKRRRS